MFPSVWLQSKACQMRCTFDFDTVSVRPSAAHSSAYRLAVSSLASCAPTGPRARHRSAADVPGATRRATRLRPVPEIAVATCPPWRWVPWTRNLRLSCRKHQQIIWPAHQSRRKGSQRPPELFPFGPKPGRFRSPHCQTPLARNAIFSNTLPH